MTIPYIMELLKKILDLLQEKTRTSHGLDESNKRFHRYKRGRTKRRMGCQDLDTWLVFQLELDLFPYTPEV